MSRPATNEPRRLRALRGRRIGESFTYSTA
jgi:hypothetical protein